MSDFWKKLIGVGASAAAGYHIGNKVAPNKIVDVDISTFGMSSETRSAMFFLERPGAFAGTMLGAIVGALLVNKMFGKMSHHMGQAQPTNNGSVQAAVTWSNGTVDMIGEEEIVAGEHLMQYVSDGVVDIAEANFGNNATEMFPAKVEVMHGKNFYQGTVEIDADGMPTMTLEDISVQKPEWSAKNANRKNANRQRASKMAIEEINAGKIPLGPGVKPNDFRIPIPK